MRYHLYRLRVKENVLFFFSLKGGEWVGDDRWRHNSYLVNAYDQWQNAEVAK